MNEKTTIWILVALVAWVLLKDRLFGEGAISVTAGTSRPPPPSTGGYGPAYGPAPSGNTYANTPPGMVSPGPEPPPKKNVWDVIDTAIHVGGAAYDTYASETYD